MGNKVTIIDYGICNIKSVANMLRKVGADSQIASNPSALTSAKKLIIPGIGSFDKGINNLEKKGLLSVLNKKVIEEHIPM